MGPGATAELQRRLSVTDTKSEESHCCSSTERVSVEKAPAAVVQLFLQSGMDPVGGAATLSEEQPRFSSR